MSQPRPASLADAEASPGSGNGFSTRDLVLGVSLTFVAAHVVLRVWMLWPSWFYGDDYALLGEADADGLSGEALVTPYAGQLMPWGRLCAWLVSDAGRLDWHAAALLAVAMSALAGLACFWMLVELFGPRWGILLPLGAYLTSAVVMPATMWWAAALNQLPLQAVLPAAVAAWVRYLRTGRSRWALITVTVLGLGLLAYVKALLVLVVLSWVTLAHFAEGGPWRRVRDLVRRHWPAVLALAALAAGYVAWWSSTVPTIVVADRDSSPGALAGTMLGRALPVGLLGGPWRWGSENAPVVLADPPAAAVVVAWVVLAALLVALATCRRRTGRVWALLAAYAGLAYLLLLVTRSPLTGAVIGLEYRYLTDVVPVAVLCLGLATMPLIGAVEPTAPRDRNRFARATPIVATVLTVALAGSGLASSVRYARVWHTDNPGRDWFDQVRSDITLAGAVDLVDRPVPPSVVSPLVTPWNTLGRLLPQAGIEPSFPEVSTRLALVRDDGRLVSARVEPVVVAERGPVVGCGHRLVGSTVGSSVTLPLGDGIAAGVFWLRIGYLSSVADEVSITAGAVTGQAPVSRGLGSIFVDITGGADDVTVSVGEGTTLCVDDVQAGPLAEGPAL